MRPLKKLRFYRELEALFTDYANNNYILKSDSDAVSYGNPSYTPFFDIEGNSRDVNPDAGAHEYQESDLEVSFYSGFSITGFFVKIWDWF